MDPINSVTQRQSVVVPSHDMSAGLRVDRRGNGLEVGDFGKVPSIISDPSYSVLDSKPRKRKLSLIL